jgi:hypothetical protein
VWLRVLREQFLTEKQEVCPAAVGQETGEADADKAAGQNVQKEATQELLRRQGHALFLISMGVILPEERNLVVVKGQEAVVADGDAVGVGGQISEDMVRATKRPLGVNDPLLAKEWPQECVKGLFLFEGLESSVEGELTVTKSLLQAGDEFAAEDAT